jgi:ATP-binding cassette subfamily B protein
MTRVTAYSSSSDEALPRKGNLKSLTAITIYLAPYKKSLIGVMIALIFTSSSVLGLGRGIQYLIDKGFGENNPALLDKALLVLLTVTLLLALATYTRASLINIICEKVVADIRRDVYRHIIRVSPSFFEHTKTSDVLSRLTTDTTLLNGIIASVMSIALRNILMLVGSLGFLIVTSPKLTAYVLVIVPLVVMPIIIMGRRVRGLSRTAQDKIVALSAHIEESLSGIKTVQAYTREEVECTQFSLKVDEALGAAVDRVRRRALLVALVISMVFGAVACVLWIGGHDVLAGKMTGGQLSSFIFYAILAASSLGALSEVASDLQRAAGATERLFELLTIQSDITDPLHPQHLPEHPAGEIIFTDVGFSYPARPDKQSLSSFSLHVHPGETIALVGPSGAGKTTLFQLLLRFYDPQHGSITLDGTELRELPVTELREQFGLVSQEAVIFSTSALENIRYGNPEASLEEVISAAKAAEAWDFIALLPQGIDTFLGEKGVRLSGGQRQRIAIARALLKNPRILLLDEATSNLDAASELLVQQALERLMKGRTTLVIAHRLSTIVNADRIIVINEGRIEAIGTHNDLAMQEGLYAKLAKLQFNS